LRHYKIDGEVFCGGSENTTPYTKIINEGMRNTFDICFSSPPYFSLETYDKSDGNQSINLYPGYDEWLQSYWAKTVFNCTDIVLNRKKDKRVFVLVMLEKYKKFNLLNDMVDICKENGLEVIKTLDIRTSKGHLSGKIKNKEVSKNTEKIVFMR
jgi:DNA modification methylase